MRHVDVGRIWTLAGNLTHSVSGMCGHFLGAVSYTRSCAANAH
jgi:hypothetical protein